MRIQAQTLKQTTDTDFAEYFTTAQESSLTTRESVIIGLRYGFTDEEAHTLEDIGHRIGVSRERIRQLLARSHRKILTKGKNQLKKGKLSEPCAVLLLYIDQIIRPQEENAIERLVDFVENNLAYMPVKQALSLIAYLAFQSKAISEQSVVEASKLVKERKQALRNNCKQQVLSEEFEGLLNFVIWPGPAKSLVPQEIACFGRKREVSTKGEGHAGLFHSDKLNRIVQYESELEHNFLLRLEQLKEITFYQEQPFEIPYTYNDQQFVYYPDVLFVLEDGRGVIVEIKPVFKMALQRNLKKWTGLKTFCAKNGFGLLVTDGRYTIQQIQRYEVNTEFSEEVLAALQIQTLSWVEYKQIRDKYSVNRNDFLALILKNRLIWQLNPFALSLSNRV
ncbi:MAG: hypothetical protein JXR84_19475 [Anaerolineae bacterium]|nr:hypothetical protein [Anaerolineae bacterium]